jgi:antirestriction protein
MTVLTDTPKVWIACLASYNAGRLVGEWVDATDIDEMYAARDRVAKAAVKEAKAAGEYPVYFGEPEEFAIHDYDNFGSLASTLGEYPSWEKVAKIGAMIEEHGAPMLAWLETLDEIDDVDESAFQQHFRGEWDSEEAFVLNLLIEEVPLMLYSERGRYSDRPDYNVYDELSSYIDWDSVARERFQHGNYTYVRANGTGYVFEDEV